MSQGGVVQHSRWRIAFFVATASLLIVTAFLLYGFIDQAVTISYMSQGYDQTKKDLEILAGAFPRDRYNKKDIVAVLRANNPGGFIVETQCAVQLDGIRFEFDQVGKLASINTRAHYTEDKACDI
jgi:hypothetical protein